ncbi:hypothetical protein [Longimicrobium sp.]|uniref:hypothetical protein n=1 Tax=Longimicrobium sp. TaxID=2029185 RepID=UPI003B3B509D
MSYSELREEVAQAIKLYEQVIRRAASRTRDMIERHGEVEALSHLVVTADLQQGFKALRDHNQLDQTFEAVVVRHPELFRRDVVESAQWRLDNPYQLLDF